MNADRQDVLCGCVYDLRLAQGIGHRQWRRKPMVNVNDFKFQLQQSINYPLHLQADKWTILCGWEILCIEKLFLHLDGGRDAVCVCDVERTLLRHFSQKCFHMNHTIDCCCFHRKECTEAFAQFPIIPVNTRTTKNKQICLTRGAFTAYKWRIHLYEMVSAASKTFVRVQSFFSSLQRYMCTKKVHIFSGICSHSHTFTLQVQYRIHASAVAPIMCYAIYFCMRINNHFRRKSIRCQCEWRNGWQ